MNQPMHQVTYSRRSTSHTFHLLMCLFTCGLWAVPWAIVTLANRRSRPTAVTSPAGVVPSYPPPPEYRPPVPPPPPGFAPLPPPPPPSPFSG